MIFARRGGAGAFKSPLRSWDWGGIILLASPLLQSVERVWRLRLCADEAFGPR